LLAPAWQGKDHDRGKIARDGSPARHKLLHSMAYPPANVNNTKCQPVIVSRCLSLSHASIQHRDRASQVTYRKIKELIPARPRALMLSVARVYRQHASRMNSRIRLQVKTLRAAVAPVLRYQGSCTFTYSTCHSYSHPFPSPRSPYLSVTGSLSVAPSIPLQTPIAAFE
jgi:hypothetical protein